MKRTIVPAYGESGTQIRDHLETAFGSIGATEEPRHAGRQYWDGRTSLDGEPAPDRAHNWTAFTTKQLAVKGMGLVALTRWMYYPNANTLTPYDCFAVTAADGATTTTTTEPRFIQPYTINPAGEEDRLSSDLLWVGGAYHGSAVIYNGKQVHFGGEEQDSALKPASLLAANVAIAALSEYATAIARPT